MVPPQHCPPAFPTEYSGIPMLMMVEQQQQQPLQQQQQHQHQQQQQEENSHSHARPGRLAKETGAHTHQRIHRSQSQHQEEPVGLLVPPPPRESQVRGEGEDGDEADPEPLLAVPGPDIIVSSDDQPIFTTENSIAPQEHAHSHHTNHRTRHHTQSLQGHSTRPQRQRRAAKATAGGSTAVGKGLKASSTPALLKSTSHPSVPDALKDTSVTAPTPTPTTTIPPPPLPVLTILPYTHTSDSTVNQSEPAPQHQRTRSAGGGLPLSLLLNSTNTIDGSQIDPFSTTERGSEARPGVEEMAQESRNPQDQQPRARNDVSPESKGAHFTTEAASTMLETALSTTQLALPEGFALENESPMESGPLGAGLKRGSRQMNSASPSIPSVPVPGKTKDISTMPAKKKAKTDASKRGENDTASLFQKIFADRDPGKRKIKTKSVHEIPMDLAADEDDSDFEDTKTGSNDDEDEDMVIPEDAASEDEIRPDQKEAFNDEQDLLTALWQWKDNDPEVCCVCLGRSTEADNVFVYCDTLDCALCVHQACYGVKTLPSESEPWLCDRCKASPEEVVSCVCCPSKDGAFRRLIPEDPSGGWVHVVCALWLPETTLGDPENVDRISVRDIPEKNWNLSCYMCLDPQDAALGACVQCDAGQCRKSFHITCAQGYSLLETIEETDMADPYFMYCKQHGAADGHPKLNGWAKWVKQRDAFLKKWQDEQGRKRTLKLIEMQHSSSGDEDGGEGLVEFFEHSYSRFKLAREKRIARERSELSRQYSIGYYLGNKIDKSRSRLEVISSKTEQALLEQRRIDMHTRNLLSSLLECANYLENVSTDELEAPLSIDTTLAWYNSLPDTSRWKSNIQDIIETIDIDSLACDNPYTQPGSQGHLDSGLDDSEGGQRHGRSSKGIYGKLSKKGGKTSQGAGKNVKSKKVHPKPTLANKSHIPVMFTSSRGRLIKRDFSDPDECYPTARIGSVSSVGEHHAGQSGHMSAAKIPRLIVPCTVCHQLTLPEDKLELERDASGVLSPMAIKVLNRLVSCDTCQRQFHPKCLNPPMARVPPRGYSWNCEDCDSSEESHGSSGEASPTLSSPHRHQENHHQHSHSSDLDEALMVLADTAMTISATNLTYRPQAPARAPKRPLGIHDTDTAAVADYPRAKGKQGNIKKKIKTEVSEKPKTTKPKMKATILDMDASKSKGKKAVRAASEAILPNGGPDAQGRPTGQPVAYRPAVAPIIRGNLRIYPPGPHIAPKITGVSMMQASVYDDTMDSEESKTKAAINATTKAPATAKKAFSAKQEEAGSGAIKKKVKSESPAKASGVKAKKQEKDDGAATVKSKFVAVTTHKKKIPTKESTPTLGVETKATKAIKAAKVVKVAASVTKEKAVVRRASVPAVPVPPLAKPKEVIRYTVGEKTVEELTAREDVEIERRENVKFRKLRGRTLTMPAPPQEALAAALGAAAGVSADCTVGSAESTTIAA